MSYTAAVAKARSWFAWASARPVRSLTAVGFAFGLVVAFLVPPMGLALWGGAHAISWIVALLIVPISAFVGNWIGAIVTLVRRRP